MDKNISLNDLARALYENNTFAPEERKEASIELLSRIVMELCKGNKSECARMMGIKPQAINNYLRDGYGNSVLRNIIQTFFNQPVQPENISAPESSAPSKEEIHMLIESFKKHIESLDKSIQVLEAQLAAKDKMINDLLALIGKDK